MFGAQFSGFPAGSAPEWPELALPGATAASGVSDGGASPTALLPVAPAGPAATTEVAVTHRETAKPATDSMIGDVMAKRSPPVGFDELLTQVGATTDTVLEDFVLVSETDMMDALGNIEIEENQLTGIQRAGLVRYVRSVFVEAGYDPPLLGSAMPAAPKAAAPPPGSLNLGTAVSPQAPDTTPEITASMVQMGDVVDQKIRAQVSMISFGDRAKARSTYERVTGAPPPEEYLPTGEQLSALRALVTSGRVPFVDFGVWSVLGPRVAKFRRTEATVFSAGAFITRSIDGPTTFQDWEASWGLFAVGMVSLQAASPGTLNAYLAGIRMLLRLFPARWGQIAAADLVVRSERWSRIREDFERAPPANFEPARPWDSVIAASAFGKDTGANAAWWQTHFVLPATLNTIVPSTVGIPDIGKQRSETSAAARRASNLAAEPSAASAEVCNQWNTRAGRCKGNAACPHGRRHVCSVCGGSHRACDQHGVATAFGRDSKGKGKGKGKKGKGKKGKADQMAADI